MAYNPKPRGGRRANRLRTLILAPLIELARELEAVDIAIGTPPGQPPAAAVRAAAQAMSSGYNGYIDPAGYLELRTVLARRFAALSATPPDPHTEITITNGCTEAVLVALLTVTDPGDEVIVLQPSFETYSGAVELAGCTLVPVALQNPGWRLEPDRLAAAFTDRTAAVIVNTPHNPTGRVFSPEEMSGLLELCERYDAVCVSDEVYADYVYDGQRHVSALSFPRYRERVIVAGSLAKTNAMPGWRIGYCVADADMTSVLRKVHERSSFSTSTPLQYGAAAMSQASCDPDRFDKNRSDMVRRLAEMGFTVHPPEGGFFVMAGTAGLGLRSEDFCVALLRSAQVLVSPGTPFFDNPEQGQAWIRTTFVKDPAEQNTALEAIEKFLASNPDGELS